MKYGFTFPFHLLHENQNLSIISNAFNSTTKGVGYFDEFFIFFPSHSSHKHHHTSITWCIIFYYCPPTCNIFFIFPSSRNHSHLNIYLENNENDIQFRQVPIHIFSCTKIWISSQFIGFVINNRQSIHVLSIIYDTFMCLCSRPNKFAIHLDVTHKYIYISSSCFRYIQIKSIFYFMHFLIFWYIYLLLLFLKNICI